MKNTIPLICFENKHAIRTAYAKLFYFYNTHMNRFEYYRKHDDKFVGYFKHDSGDYYMEDISLEYNPTRYNRIDKITKKMPIYPTERYKETLEIYKAKISIMKLL
jgi:hypothetical protein